MLYYQAGDVKKDAAPVAFENNLPSQEKQE
jgi:hypothetical protein